jgi:hypothetical protein
LRAGISGAVFTGNGLLEILARGVHHPVESIYLPRTVSRGKSAYREKGRPTKKSACLCVVPSDQSLRIEIVRNGLGQVSTRVVVFDGPNVAAAQAEGFDVVDFALH